MTAFQRFMDAHQLTQYRLHRLTGISKSQISEWQRGKHRPTRESVFRIAAALRMSAHSILAELETRERYQNARTEDGTFVARTKENSRALVETNDSGRTDGIYCIACRQMIRNTASTLTKAA